MVHDFKKYPELSNAQMDFYYFESPHRQITEDFVARVIKVKDGDTVQVRAEFRDFDFPIRFLDTNAPEMDQGGSQSRDWLKQEIEGEEIEVLINPRKRVGKFGRILGEIFHQGRSINKLSLNLGYAIPFIQDNLGDIPDTEKLFKSQEIK